jgi:Flp pilus assembly pilin Flp
MKNLFREFVIDELGQDMVEYTLLLAFVCLMSGALFLDTHTSMGTIWRVTEDNLSEARIRASS